MGFCCECTSRKNRMGSGKMVSILVKYGCTFKFRYR